MSTKILDQSGEAKCTGRAALLRVCGGMRKGKIGKDILFSGGNLAFHLAVCGLLLVFLIFFLTGGSRLKRPE